MFHLARTRSVCIWYTRRSLRLHLGRRTARSNCISGTRDGSVEPHLWHAGRLGRTASGHLVRRTTRSNCIWNAGRLGRTASGAQDAYLKLARATAFSRQTDAQAYSSSDAQDDSVGLHLVRRTTWADCISGAQDDVDIDTSCGFQLQSSRSAFHPWHSARDRSSLLLEPVITVLAPFTALRGAAAFGTRSFVTAGLDPLRCSDCCAWTIGPWHRFLIGPSAQPVNT